MTGFDKLRASAVCDAVRDARRYREYPMGGVEVVFDADPRLRDGTYTKVVGENALTRGRPRWRAQRARWRMTPDREDRARPREVRRHYAAFVRYVTGQSAGLVMPKHTVLPGHALFGDDPLAQLRPNEPIRLAGRETSKYLNTPGPTAKRLDRNPMTDLGTAEVFWFVMEGAIKNDALVSWARRHGRGSSWGVFNTPSVTTWAGYELDGDWDDAGRVLELEALIAAYVREDNPQPFVIVVDFDTPPNTNVLWQAELVGRVLTSRGIPYTVVAPRSGEKGVDDHLAAGHHPLDMATFPQGLPSAGYMSWRSSVGRDIAPSALALADLLVERSTEDGRAVLLLDDLGDAVGSRSTATRGIRRLVNTRLITVERHRWSTDRTVQLPSIATFAETYMPNYSPPITVRQWLSSL